VRRAAAVLVVLLAGGVAACSLILGIPGDRFVVDGGCEVPDAFGGQTCFGCTPMSSEELLNACTPGACTPFDNRARIANFDGKLRPLPPPPDAGADLAPDDGGEPDGGIDDGGPPLDDGGGAADLGGGGVACASLKNPVYLYGSSGLSLGMKTLAQAIASVATIVYLQDASCNGLDAILTGDPRMQGRADYWVANLDDPQKCDLEPQGHAPDIGLCDVFPNTCIPNFPGLPANVGDFQGPVQTFMFTVPRKSTQTAISAEAAYNVYGFGSQSGVAPWTDERYIAKRTSKSGNQSVIGATIGVPPPQWRGDTVVSASDMVPHLLAYSDPERAIGITSADVADKMENRMVVRTLAYQHLGQKCAFLPDSELGSYDKRNVRDGHYFLWAPIHFYTRVQNGIPPNPLVRDVVNFLIGAKPLPDPNYDLISAFKASGLIPGCAMSVSRSREGGALVPAAPKPSCDCYFDKAAPGGGAIGCQVCGKDADCPQSKPSCNFGYCEPR
jgi:hypothetical protein